MIFPALVFLGLKNNDCCGCCGNESCGKRFAVSERKRSKNSKIYIWPIKYIYSVHHHWETDRCCPDCETQSKLRQQVVRAVLHLWCATDTHLHCLVQQSQRCCDHEWSEFWRELHFTWHSVTALPSRFWKQFQKVFSQLCIVFPAHCRPVQGAAYIWLGSQKLQVGTDPGKSPNPTSCLEQSGTAEKSQIPSDASRPLKCFSLKVRLDKK